jgi:4-hydroxy-2-oxoheptanedioate aldolase
MKVGAWCTLGEPRATIAVEQAGLDWVGLDAQHGHFDDASLRETFALRRNPAVPVLVRVLSDDPAGLGRVLDYGADGIIVPMIDTPEQAQSVVEASRYPPHGVRSWGPLGYAGDYRADVGDQAEPMVSVMIETRSALAGVSAIAATPGLHMLFVGPFDLARALGMSLEDLLADDSPRAPLRVIADACAEANIIAGAFAGSKERATVLGNFGYSWIAASTDRGLLTAGAASLRGLDGPSGRSGA